MAFAVYDYRTDIRNVLVTPQIRSRFVRMEPGPTPSPHSHDLGHEVFLVLSGRALFEIDGETKEARLVRLWSPIVVQGPLTAPRVGVDTGSVVGQTGLAGILGAVVNPLVALLPFVDPGLAEDANCGALIASAR